MGALARGDACLLDDFLGSSVFVRVGQMEHSLVRCDPDPSKSAVEDAAESTAIFSSARRRRPEDGLHERVSSWSNENGKGGRIGPCH